MKNLNLLLAAAAMLAVSCTQNETIQDESLSGNVIGFSTYVNRTRAVANGDVNLDSLKTDNFGVTGYYGNAVYLGKDVEQTYDGSNWEYADAAEMKFWPTASDAKLDFYAYFPSSVTASFADSNSTGDVLTLTGWSDGQDLLYATDLQQAKVARAPLQFKHAFSKIKEVNVSSSLEDLSVQITKIEFVATSTSGTVKVAADGSASYASGSAPRAITLDKTVTKSASQTLFGNTANAYIFPVASGIWANDPKPTAVGTGTAIKLTAKVIMKGVTLHDGAIYIPMGVSTLDAAKRYIFNITFKNGIGYDENGNDLILPIKFSATVSDWTDATAVDIEL